VVLCDRIDQIMMGKADVPYDRMMMQLDPVFSDVNRSDRSRRAFSVCMVDAATCWSENGEPAGFPMIFGEGAMA